jgi:hypothetical protein
MNLPVPQGRPAPVSWAPNHADRRGAVIAAPMSFVGSAQHIWRLLPDNPGSAWVTPVVGASLVVTIGLAWVVVAGWYMTFGLLVVPYRLIRRSQRKNKVDAQRHRDLIAVLEAGRR